MNFPLITFNELFHVGTMNPEHKERESHEGAGLSVSTEPDAWIRIAKLGGRSLHLLSKTNNSFLNFHKLLDEQKEEIIDWGVTNGYVYLGNTYRVPFYNEYEEEVYMEFVNLNDAQQEAEGMESDVIEIPNAVLSTPKLQERVLSRAEPIMVLDLLSTVFVEDVLNIDGVWWDDILDVPSYSAPRGVIVPSKLSDWHIDIID